VVFETEHRAIPSAARATGRCSISAIRNLIRENKTFRITSAIQTGAKFGMQLMDDALFKLWRDEKTTVEDVLAKAASPDDLAKRILNAKQGVFEMPQNPEGGPGGGGHH